MLQLDAPLRAGALYLGRAGLAALLLSASTLARAENASSAAPGFAPIDAYNELETKYIFGFTDGADIGLEGEKAIDLETTTAFGMRGGSFRSIEQEIEFEHVPTQFFAYELAAHGLMQQIYNVEGLNNLNRTNFGGLSAKLRFLLFERRPDQPLGLTAIVEPGWGRVDDGSGALTTDFSTTFKLVADTELIPNRLYAAANLIYEPGVSREFGAPKWEQGSSLGLTAAMAYRIAPRVTLGGELQYYREFEGLGMQNFVGDALYIGPTLHIQLSGHVMVAAAFSTQIAGHSVGDDRVLNLADFQRYLGNLKVEIEF